MYIIEGYDSDDMRFKIVLGGFVEAVRTARNMVGVALVMWVGRSDSQETIRFWAINRRNHSLGAKL